MTYVEKNYSQFCDLYIDDTLISTKMIILVFRPDGLIVNANSLMFEVNQSIRGFAKIKLLGQYIAVDPQPEKFRRGDTVTVGPGALSLWLEDPAQRFV